MGLKSDSKNKKNIYRRKCKMGSSLPHICSFYVLVKVVQYSFP